MGAGRGDHQDAVLLDFLGHRNARTARYCAEGNLHAVIHELVVSVHGHFRVGLVIFKQELERKAVYSASFVDFLHSHFGTLLNGYAIGGIVAGEGPNAADDKLFAFSGGFARAGIRRGIGRGRSFGTGGGFGGFRGAVGASCERGKDHHEGQCQCKDLFHWNCSPSKKFLNLLCKKAAPRIRDRLSILGRLARSPRQSAAANNNNAYYSEDRNNDQYADHRYDGGAAKDEGACKRSAHAGTCFCGKC